MCQITALFTSISGVIAYCKSWPVSGYAYCPDFHVHLPCPLVRGALSVPESTSLHANPHFRGAKQSMRGKLEAEQGGDYTLHNI